MFPFTLRNRGSPGEMKKFRNVNKKLGPRKERLREFLCAPRYNKPLFNALFYARPDVFCLRLCVSGVGLRALLYFTAMRIQ